MKTLFTLAGAVLFLALLVALFSKSSGRTYRYKRKPLLTPNEREFYGRLTHALPEYLVFPQLAMSAVITPTTGARDREAWAKISQKVVDFGIYTHDFQLICLVELDDRTHRKDRDAAMATPGVRPMTTSVLAMISSEHVVLMTASMLLSVASMNRFTRACSNT